MTELPDTMKAVTQETAGSAAVLRLGDVPAPRPGPGEVLIKVAAAGVNRPDVLQRQGLYPPPAGASPILGLEVAGVVVAAGDATAPGIVGQRVCALLSGGGYAQYAVADARHCLPVGPDRDLTQAAAIPETLFTVWHNVFQRGLARDGEVLLVHGGTSGIGTMATMLAKAFGLLVVTTCGSADKCAESRRIGADLAINYRAQDFVEEVRAFTNGRGAEVVLDMVSGDYVGRNLECLAVDGRHVTIAVLGGPAANINMARVMVKRHTLTGSTLRPRSGDFKAELTAEITREVWPLFESGQLAPVLDRTFPLAQAGAAHARMEAGDHIGKIVLEVAAEER